MEEKEIYSLGYIFFIFLFWIHDTNSYGCMFNLIFLFVCLFCFYFLNLFLLLIKVHYAQLKFKGSSEALLAALLGLFCGVSGIIFGKLSDFKVCLNFKNK